MRPDIGGRRFVAVVLAAQRAGTIDPLAAEAGLSHKCLVPIQGTALIAHVAAALQATRGLAELRIVVEPEVQDAVRALLPGGPAPVSFVAARDNLADSVLAAAQGLDLPTIVTTADNVLLTPDAVLRMRAALSGADVALAMATKASVLAAHPDGQRRFYRFRDDEYSNCNLYGFSGARAFAAAESFRGGGQFAKKPMRLVVAVGVVNVALMAMGRLTLKGAMARLSRRFRLTVAPVVLPDGSHAIDVDNARTFGVASQLLRARAEAMAEPVRLRA